MTLNPSKKIEEYVAKRRYMANIADFLFLILAEIVAYVYRPANQKKDLMEVYVVQTKDHYNSLIPSKKKRKEDLSVRQQREKHEKHKEKDRVIDVDVNEKEESITTEHVTTSDLHQLQVKNIHH